VLVDTKKIALIKIWSHMMQGARDYVRSQGFTEIVGLPAVTSISGSCENVLNLFSLDYFGKDAFLAQSNQFIQSLC
jgi:nondiscriminating aspartyl-tRNA synthetase